VEFQDVIRKRKMVRSFEKRPLPPGALDRMLDNARRAPSAGFSQGWAFLTFEGDEEMESFWRAAGSEEGFRSMGWPEAHNAAAAIVPLAHARAYTERYSAPDKAAFGMQQAEAWPTPYWLVDTSFAAMAILLTAVDQGLGALFFGLRDIPAFRAATGVPDEYHPIGVIIVGHPAPDRPSPSLQRGRRPKEDVVHRGRWQSRDAG
jgi:nitroreductase